jgi:hypothetical protein
MSLRSRIQSRQVGMGMTAVSEVDQIDSQVDAQIEAANTAVLACATMSPGDVTVWSGYYSAWKAIHQQWKYGSLSRYIPPFFGATLLYFTTDTFLQMKSYADQLPTWQTKIHAACSTYSPPPTLVLPAPPDPNKPDKLVQGLQIASGAALTLATAYAVYKVAEIVGDVRASTKAAHG